MSEIKMCIYMHILIEIAFNMKGLESVIDEYYILNVAWTSLKLFVGDSIMQKKGGDHHYSEFRKLTRLLSFVEIPLGYFPHDMTPPDSKWQKDAADQNFDYMFKLLIIGNSSVGKTSFLFRYADDSFTSAFVSTVGIDFKVKTVFRHDKRVKLQIWNDWNSTNRKEDANISETKCLREFRFLPRDLYLWTNRKEDANISETKCLREFRFLPRDLYL
ncbi:Ras family [Popillia japonica]|uniref:Ras family n=1 Tax=Popillia japonica TaxID=7064 RepID=A0AAW1K3Q3_POPJA